MIINIQRLADGKNALEIDGNLADSSAYKLSNETLDYYCRVDLQVFEKKLTDHILFCEAELLSQTFEVITFRFGNLNGFNTRLILFMEYPSKDCEVECSLAFEVGVKLHEWNRSWSFKEFRIYLENGLKGFKIDVITDPRAMM